MNEIKIEGSDVQEVEVIRQVLEGKVEQYEWLIRKYNQRLFRLGMSYLHQDSDVQDAMQNTYIKAYYNLKNFGFHASFSTWIMRIMINECLQQVRKKRFYAPIEEPEAVSHHVLSYENGESNLIQKEMKALLENSILSLPTKYRTVYMLREIEEMSTGETAAALDISESNVKIRLYRAKEWLRDEILRRADGVEVFPFRSGRCDLLVDRVMTLIRENTG